MTQDKNERRPDRIEHPFAKVRDVCLSQYLLCRMAYAEEGGTRSELQALITEATSDLGADPNAKVVFHDVANRLKESACWRAGQVAVQQSWDAFVAAMQDTIKGIAIARKFEPDANTVEFDVGYTLAKAVKSKKVDSDELKRLARDFDLPLLALTWFQEVAIGLHRLRNHIVHRQGFIDLSYDPIHAVGFEFPCLHGCAIESAAMGCFDGFLDQNAKLNGVVCTIPQGMDGGRRTFVRLPIKHIENILCTIMYMNRCLASNALMDGRRIAVFASFGSEDAQARMQQ